MLVAAKASSRFRHHFENLALDGNKANNENLDGNYAGCVFLQDCSRVTMRGVTARSYNGDTFQTWKGFNPRLGAVYDLFGNGKTAVKFSANKYETNVTDTLTNTYNPLASQSATVTWRRASCDTNSVGPACQVATPLTKSSAHSSRGAMFTKFLM